MCEIKAATESHFEGISRLIKSKDELYLVYPNGTYPFTLEQVKKIAQKRKELTVVTDDDKVIGFANLYDYTPGKFAFIGNLVLSEPYRGKGLGKKIISYMLEKAKQKYNLPEVRISVFNENTTALLLYTRFGFIPYSVEERKNPYGEKTALIHMKRLS